MSYIMDRLIILSLSLYLFFLFSDKYAATGLSFGTETGTGSVVLVLVVIIVASLLSYFDSRKSKGALILCYSLAAIFVPSLAVLSPVIFYDIYCGSFGALAAVIIIAIINAARYYHIKLIAGSAVLCVLACVLYYKSSKNENLNRKVKQIRDDGKEKTMLLAEKNKSLIEKQDSELYVATLKERNRIAREIHDNVGHMLTRSILQMGALITIYKDEPINSQLSSVKESLDTAMNNVRESVHDLHDESIDLKSAVSEAAESLKEKFEYRLEYDMSANVDRKYKYAIIGIVKEAVSNIIKYSRNNMVDIILREHPAMFQIVIHDYTKNAENGKSNDTTSLHNSKNETNNVTAAASGIGLQNMHDRVDALKGNITITDNNGYKIFVTLPKER